MSLATRPIAPAVLAALQRASVAFAEFDAQVAAERAGDMPPLPAAGGRTIADFLAELDSLGVTLSDWIRRHGFSFAVVSTVVNGPVRGSRGEARRVLLAMGVEPPPVVSRFKLVRERKA